MTKHEIESKVGEVVTAIDGHLSGMTYTEKQTFMDKLASRIEDIEEDIADEVDDLDLDEDEDFDDDDDDFDDDDDDT